MFFPSPLPFPSSRILVGRLLRFLERACVRRRTLVPRHTLNLRPNAAQYSGGGGGVLRCYFNTMYVCIYRKTDAPQLYLFSFKGHAARVTWARAYAPDPRRQTIQTGPLFVCVGDTSVFIYLVVRWLATN
jgi:hypothetical protein